MFNAAKGRPQEEDAPLFTAGNNSASRRAKAWMAAQVKASNSSKPFGVTYLLTPELAEHLLSVNACNRPFKPGKIRDYVRDIEDGRWPVNGEPVIISQDGWLNDGQNRCKAVIVSGKAMETMFVFGVTRESRMTVDQGAARTSGDYLHMGQVKNANTTALAARILYLYLKFGRIPASGDVRPTKTQIQEIVEAHPDLCESVAKCSWRIGRTSPGLIAFAHYILAQKNRAKADEFVAALKSGANLSGNNPILVLRNRLSSVTTRDPMNEEMKAEIIFRAWNMWRRGETTTKLQVGPKFPVPRS